MNEETKPLAAHTDTEVLVGQLKGIVLVSDPKQVKARGVASGPGVDAGSITLAQNPEFNSTMQPYLGQPVTMKSLAELTRAIVAYFRDHDRPVVNVFVPEQRITTGYVQVVVLISQVEKIDATGAKWFSNSYLRAQVQLRPEEPISGHELNRDLKWINRNPFFAIGHPHVSRLRARHHRSAVAHAGPLPLRVYAGFEDSGNQFTGNDRILTGFNYGNLFGVGQQLSYQFTSGTDVNKFTAHSGTYIIPLPWKHQLTFFGSYANSEASLGPGLTSGGVNWQVSGRYEIPLPGTEQFTESITAGFDFKRSNDDLIFNVATVSNVYTDIDQFVFGYQSSLQDEYGSTSFSGTGFWSPGGLSNNNDDTDFQATRAAARDNYIYGQLTLNRVTRLPYDFSWTVRGLLQESDANLLPSEQLGLGGYDTVRGYDERVANGDNGFLVSTEVATPPVSLLQLIGLQSVKDQLQFLAFVDYGGTSLHQVTPADITTHNNLLGVGPGLRYAINPYLTARADYGFQLIDSQNSGFDTHHNSRLHFGLVVSY